VIPRDYQRAAVAAARERTAAHGNTLLMLPTASGKTAIAGFYIAEEAADDPASRFLVLQHTDELIEQNQATIGRITALPGSIVKAERDDWSGRVVFGSVQTLARANRRARMTPVSHLVIDECHRAAADSYQVIIGHARSLRNGIKLLGLSATPERGDGRSLRRTFSNVGIQVPIADLIEQGILVPPRTYTIDLGVADELAAINETAGDYDMTEAAAVLNHEVLNDAVVEHWKARAADRRTIAFCSTIEHAEAVATAFRADGISAETITGEMPARARADLIARFDRGEVQVLTNCMVLTEGFDSQPIGCIVILRRCGTRAPSFRRSAGACARSIRSVSRAS
jgi:DNA repair protein RadD